MKKPKILFYDIETSPNLAYVWGKYKQDVIAFKEERQILSFAYKWQGQKTVKVVSNRNTFKTDKQLVNVLATLLQEADIVVAHNGDNFDRKIVKTRMLYWGLKPLKINCSVDTLKAARSYFNFNGNSLNDLARYLNLGEKLANPGISLWIRCMEGDPKSWSLMEKYNKQDVVILEKLYDKLAPWIENHPNVAKLLGKDKTLFCPLCSSVNTQKHGFRVTNQVKQQRHICLDCGKNYLTRIEK